MKGKTCRNWRLGSCPRSDAIILEEGRDHIQMGCRTCRGGWVVTMPEGRAKARYENRLKQIREHQERERAKKGRKVFGQSGI